MGHARIRAAHGWGEEDEREEAMITSVEIENFKSIKSLTIDLPKFAVLVGPNGSGKTNIVQAIELFSEILQRGTIDPARDRGWDQIVRRAQKAARTLTLGTRVDLDIHEVNGGSAPPKRVHHVALTARVTLALRQDKEDIRIAAEEIVAESAKSRLRVSSSPDGLITEAGEDPLLWEMFALPTVFGARPIKQPSRAEVAIRELFGVAGVEPGKSDETILRVLNRMRFPFLWTYHLRTSASATRFRLDASALRSDSYSREPMTRVLGPSGEGLPAAVDRLRGGGREPSPAFKRVLEALRSVYPRIEDVRPARIQSGRLTLLFKERGIAEDLGQANVSDGVLHALALLVLLEAKSLTDDTGLLVIEEPENAVHPWTVRSMIERAQSSERQVLVTTHSETVVNAVKDPASLLIVENDDKKGTIVAKARDRETALDTILTETGQKLGDVWMDGSLGGVPGR